MSYRDTVLFNAYNEAQQPVHWAKHESRILEYFQTSTGKAFTKKPALKISWCSYFVHWCLVQGGMNPLPVVGGSDKVNAIGRFMKPVGGCYEAYPVFQKKYRPRPGDMYNKLVPNNHIGLVRDVREISPGTYEILTIDGNSGPQGFSAYFDSSAQIGSGFIYQRPEWRRLSGQDWYIKLCDAD
jgi:hypothetical protein